MNLHLNLYHHKGIFQVFINNTKINLDQRTLYKNYPLNKNENHLHKLFECNDKRSLSFSSDTRTYTIENDGNITTYILKILRAS